MLGAGEDNGRVGFVVQHGSSISRRVSLIMDGHCSYTLMKVNVMAAGMGFVVGCRGCLLGRATICSRFLLNLLMSAAAFEVPKLGFVFLVRTLVLQ